MSKIEDRRILALQKRASLDCIDVERYLRSLGYDFVALSIAQLVPESPGEAGTPGATIISGEQRMLPTYPHQARILRQMAERLEEEWRKSGLPESTDGYSEDVIVAHPVKGATH